MAWYSTKLFVWVLNNFFEILAEEFIIIRQGQVPIEVGGHLGSR